MSFFLTKWIRGWRLDKFFESLHAEVGVEISVKDAAAKVISIIDQALALWAQYEATFDAIFSDEAEDSADKAKALMLEIKANLEEIETLPDIAAQLQNYRFADDDERNTFYHSLVTTAAIAFSDKKISVYEAGSFVAQIALYVKEHK